MSDIYVVLSGWGDGFEQVSLRVLVNPAIGWMWVGGLIFFLGVLIVFWPGAVPRLTAADRGSGGKTLAWQAWHGA